MDADLLFLSLGVGTDRDLYIMREKAIFQNKTPELDDEIDNNYVEINELQVFDYIKGIHKPTTVIYQNAKNLANNLMSDDGSVAIRVCKDQFCKELIHQYGKPIVSTSANISSYPTALCFNDISMEIVEGVDYVVKHRREENEIQQPSSIIKWDETGQLIIIRP